MSSYKAFVREQLPQVRLQHPRHRLEPKPAYHKRTLKLLGAAWAGSDEHARFDGTAAVERRRRRLRVDPLKSFLVDAETLPAADAASFPWGLADK